MPNLHARPAERRKLGKVVEERALREQLTLGRVTTTIRVGSPCIRVWGRKGAEKRMK